jgi:hypothetical protein
MAKTKTESKEQISIDLDTILNPNPGLIQTYADANAERMWWEKDTRPEYVNEKRIFAAAKASKKPIKHNIFCAIQKTNR